MAGFLPVGGGGGGGGGDLFALGPPVNTFNGADRTAAETARDAYDTANPGWIDDYNADSEIGIYLTFTSGGEPTVVSQVRIGGAWRDVQTVVGVRGSPGAGTDFSGITTNHIPAIGAGNLPFDSGLSVTSEGDFVARRKIEVPSASLRFDELLEISEGSGDVLVNNRLSGEFSEVISVRTQNTQASGRPTAFRHTEAENDFTIQGDDTNTITTNPFTFQYTTTLDAQTNALRFRTGAQMVNARMRIVDNATGIAIKHLPDKAAWDEGVGGVTLRAGDNTINLMSEAPDDPPNGVFNVGITPFRFRVGRVLDIEVRADSVSLLGITSPSEFPYLIAQLQRSTVDELAMLSDVQGNVQGHVSNLTIVGLPSRIDSTVGDLQGTYNATYDVTNHNLITSLQLSIVGSATVNKVVTAPTADGTVSFSFTITSGDWTSLFSGPPATITFQLNGTDTHGNAFTSNTVTVTVSSLTADQYFYHGLSSSNNPSTIPLGNLLQTEVETGQQTFTFSVGPATAGQFALLLYRSDKAVTSIVHVQTGVEIRQELLQEDDDRVINSVNFSSYALGPLSDGFSGSFRVTAGT